MTTTINVNDIPLGGNLEATKFKYLHSNMGDFYVLFCRDLKNGEEYNILITDGFAFKYIDTIRQTNNPFKFNIKRLLDDDSGQHIISINEEHNWKILH